MQEQNVNTTHERKVKGKTEGRPQKLWTSAAEESSKWGKLHAEEGFQCQVIMTEVIRCNYHLRFPPLHSHCAV